MSFQRIKLPRVIIPKRGLSDILAEKLAQAMKLSPKDVKKILDL